jgi:RNA polymerase sigma-70 factor (ECF subfamily)
LLNKESLDNLMIRISHKDMTALEEFYYEIHGAVYGLAYVLTKSHHDAEDIMQNTFIQVWDKAGTYRPGTNAKAWTMTIARNFSLSNYKRKKRYVELDFDIETSDMLTHSLDKQIINRMLSILKKDEREIVTLYTIGFSHKEIAGIVKKPYPTVRWKYRYAIQKLTEFEREDQYEGTKNSFTTT